MVLVKWLKAIKEAVDKKAMPNIPTDTSGNVLVSEADKRDSVDFNLPGESQKSITVGYAKSVSFYIHNTDNMNDALLTVYINHGGVLYSLENGGISVPAGDTKIKRYEITALDTDEVTIKPAGSNSSTSITGSIVISN